VFDDWSEDPGETFIGVPFLSRSSLMGAITLEHGHPRPYTNLELQFLSSIGHLLGAELRLSHLHKEKADLLLELETRKLVERGKGILQRDLGLSEHETLLALQHQSQQKKRPMRKVARAIIPNAEVRQSVVQPE
jgi:uroporphyrinogen-III synthase